MYAQYGKYDVGTWEILRVLFAFLFNPFVSGLLIGEMISRGSDLSNGQIVFFCVQIFFTVTVLAATINLEIPTRGYTETVKAQVLFFDIFRAFFEWCGSVFQQY